jgi:hypothetical protein
MKPVRICQLSQTCVSTSFNAKKKIRARVGFADSTQNFEREIDGRLRCRFTRAARWMSWKGSILAALLLLVHAAPAAADTRDAAAGEVMFREGRRLLKAGDLQGACAKLEESQRLDPAPGTLANLGECEEQLGRTASAWEHWRRAAEALPANDARRATAQAHSTELEKKLARLSITLAPQGPDPIAGLMVKRDGVVLGAASLGIALPLDPGRHAVLVSATGRQPRTFDLNVAAGEQRQLSVTVGPPSIPSAATMAGAGAGGSSPLDLHATAPAADSSGNGRRITGYLLLGAGTAAVGSGIFFGTRALQARSDAKKGCAARDGSGQPPVCWARARDALARDTTYSRLADASIAGGVLAALVGGYLAFTSPSHAGKPERLAWFAVPTVHGAEVSLAARF